MHSATFRSSLGNWVYTWILAHGSRSMYTVAACPPMYAFTAKMLTCLAPTWPHRGPSPGCPAWPEPGRAWGRDWERSRGASPVGRDAEPRATTAHACPHEHESRGGAY